MSKLKAPQKRKLQQQNRESSKCEAPNDSIYFNFKYITSKKGYNLEYLNSGDSRPHARKLLVKLAELSQSSWKELGTKSKYSGGFETMAISQLSTDITDQTRRNTLTKDTKLHVFRFGDCRLVGLKAERCRATLHVLGFDWDYSLYDHGEGKKKR